jgi:exosortase A
MKLDPEELLRSEFAPASAGRAAWRTALLAIAAAVIAILALYRETASSMVAIWGSSETFAHGYVIVPITLALVWMKRRQVAALAPAPDYLGFLLLAVAGLGWLVGEAGQVQVLQHYAMSAMVPAAVVALAGRRVALALAFPLAFILLAVPFGEAFLPQLVNWTADSTVAALRASGIPVYREGTYFAIPTGQWSVVEACSGLRYLIASVTVGALYAYLTYRLFWKRALFMALSVIVPIVANFMRAYMIVMIGHLSSMKLAVGVDHFIYGWVFFGLVIGALFWLGSFWRDPPASEAPGFSPATPATPGRMACAALGLSALAAAWPFYAHHLDTGNEAPSTLAAAPAAASGWALQPQLAAPWTPDYGRPAAAVLAVYRKGDREVTLYLAHYRNQRQGSKLVSSRNLIAGGAGSAWASMGEATHSEELAKGPVDLRQTGLRSARARLLVWDWYRIGERDLSNPYLAKALLARDKLLGRGDDSAAIAMAAPYDGRPDAAAETLRLFAREMLPSIDAALSAAMARNSG